MTTLTQHGQIDAPVSRRRFLEVNATPVQAGIGALDRLDAQRRRMAVVVEVRFGGEYRLVRPVNGLLERFPPGIEAAHMSVEVLIKY